MTTDKHLAPAPELVWDEHPNMTNTQVLQKVAERLEHLLNQGGNRGDEDGRDRG